MATNSELIRVVDVKKEYNNGEVKALTGCDLTVTKGEVVAIIGASGSGKSTLLRCLNMLETPTSGHIYFDEVETRNMSVSDWVATRQHHLSCLFQELRLFPELTAFENVQIKNKLTGCKKRQQIVEWFERMGIPDKFNAKVGQMSFGQQQRVAMIRALVQPYDFILLDEPISHLDDPNSLIMGDILVEEAHQQGAGVIVTSIGKHMQLPYDHVLKL